MIPCAKVVADSIAPDGSRLTSIEATGHRFILAEVNTHRAISKNSASSRAIPLHKQLARITDDPAIPVSMPVEQKGMSGGAELTDVLRRQADSTWLEASQMAVHYARELGEIGVHKSVANRIIEPYNQHTMLLTATAWGNFFDLRCAPDAQPEFRVLAMEIREAIQNSTPRILREDEWHLPYIRVGEAAEIEAAGLDVRQVSAGRCARLSYLTQAGIRDFNEDVGLFESLAGNGHWSPMEHVATPWAINRQQGRLFFGGAAASISLDHLPRIGNLVGWRSLRVETEAVRGELTYR